MIRGARVLDPREGIDAARDVVVRGGAIAELAEPGGAQAPEGAEVVDGEGLLALPAFVDPHVHFRVPGQEHKEDLETGTRAAAAGGYCAVIAMANTQPPIDSAAVLGSVRELAEREASVPVGFVANVTRGMEGAELTEMAELRDAGAIGFSDDGLPIRSARVLRRALQYQRLAGGVIALHEEDPELSGDGRHARGRGLGRARPGRDPLGLGVDDDRPRLLPGPLSRTRGYTSSTSRPGPRSRRSPAPRPPACRSPARRAPTT